MNLQSFIKSQPKTKNVETTKIYFLRSVSELLISPKKETAKEVFKYLAILANTFHVELKKVKPQNYKNINSNLLVKTSEVINNKNGFSVLLPELLKILISYNKKQGFQVFD